MVPSVSSVSFPSGTFGVGLTVLQTAILFATYQGERTKPTEYSKFASIKEKKLRNPIPSKIGMLIIYCPALLVAGLHAFHSGMAETLVAPLLVIHFAKRTLEVLFLHKYSGSLPSQEASMIGVFYALNTALISTYAISSGSNDPGWLIIGYLMFCVGSLGNLYHHFLLANLRTGTKGERRYQPPRGGLFKYVATPHYFFELVAWLGIACVAQQVNAFLVFANMLAYLLARAKNTNDFYRSKFDSKEWPLSRKALVPYLT